LPTGQEKPQKCNNEKVGGWLAAILDSRALEDEPVPGPVSGL
jgi:hypothetical protein